MRNNLRKNDKGMYSENFAEDAVIKSQIHNARGQMKGIASALFCLRQFGLLSLEVDPDKSIVTVRWSDQPNDYLRIPFSVVAGE